MNHNKRHKISTTPAIEQSPAMKIAFEAAVRLNSARRSYAEYERDMFERLERAAKDVREAERFGDSYSHRAGNMLQAVMNLSSNMRPDLVAKYAGEIDTQSAILKAIESQLTEAEKAELAKILV